MHMKTTLNIFAFFLIFFPCTFATVNTFAQNTVAQKTISIQVFYDDLSPHGKWTENATHGYVWKPNVAAGFMPYATNGYWALTNAGWTWMSNYSWGWAAFHYGRWLREKTGWVWVPDSEWSPAWVSWRQGDGFYGWAPIAPGVNLNTAYSKDYDLPASHWTFVKHKDLGKPNLAANVIARNRNESMLGASTVINNIRVDKINYVTYNAGPVRAEAELFSGKTYLPLAITDSKSRANNLRNGKLEMYRPWVEINNETVNKPSPVKPAELEVVKFSDRQKNQGGGSVKIIQR